MSPRPTEELSQTPGRNTGCLTFPHPSQILPPKCSPVCPLLSYSTIDFDPSLISFQRELSNSFPDNLPVSGQFLISIRPQSELIWNTSLALSFSCLKSLSGSMSPIGYGPGSYYGMEISSGAGHWGCPSSSLASHCPKLQHIWKADLNGWVVSILLQQWWFSCLTLSLAASTSRSLPKYQCQDCRSEACPQKE